MNFLLHSLFNKNYFSTLLKQTFCFWHLYRTRIETKVRMNVSVFCSDAIHFIHALQTPNRCIRVTNVDEKTHTI